MNKAQKKNLQNSKSLEVYKSSNQAPYDKFDHLNGDHPWTKYVPAGSIQYKARNLKNGKVAYFNFPLAKEMGLIPNNHPEKLTPQLEKKLLEIFNIRIINEFDIENKTEYINQAKKNCLYMSTRYLQLQHSNKQGRTSGDGRCIWNGQVTHNGTTWDVSSRGTGVTSLSPGSVEAGKNLESGKTEFGYGCGLADLDELIAAAIMSEIIHKQNINTERMLLVIDNGDSCGIGVRAGKNLIRPAHLFLYLKQSDYENLKKSADYLIDRQYENKAWKFSSKDSNCYNLMLNEIITSFAKFSAQLDRKYIFAWFDWDGDNVLANSGIIDYGSIRQFGARHDQYKYDDVDRFSTNLNQQIKKTRQMMQAFIQAIDFLETKKKKSISKFKNHIILKKFDQLVQFELYSLFLEQMGFQPNISKLLINLHLKDVKKMYLSFKKCESLKVSNKLRQVPDGVNSNPIFNMRKWTTISTQAFARIELFGDSNGFDLTTIFNSAICSFSKKDKKRFSKKSKIQLSKLQDTHFKLLSIACGISHLSPIEQIETQLDNIKKHFDYCVVTGNGLINVVSEILDQINKSKGNIDSIWLIQSFIDSQKIGLKSRTKLHVADSTTETGMQILDSLHSIVAEHQEEI